MYYLCSMYVIVPLTTGTEAFFCLHCFCNGCFSSRVLLSPCAISYKRASQMFVNICISCHLCASSFCMLQILEDWRYIAMVIDRLQLYIFLAVGIGGTLGIIVSAPHIFESIDQDEIKRRIIGSNDWWDLCCLFGLSFNALHQNELLSCVLKCNSSTQQASAIFVVRDTIGRKEVMCAYDIWRRMGFRQESGIT